MTEQSGQMDPLDPAAIHAALFNQDLLLGQHDQALHSFVEQKQVTYQCLDQMCSTIQSIHTGLPQASVTELAAWSSSPKTPVMSPTFSDAVFHSQEKGTLCSSAH